ncbi:MAG: 50S ribosomal protein L19 [Rhizobiales bacterium]|nr:50S ribosomal protein L19 [Hyphomicrobiales bacterium]
MNIIETLEKEQMEAMAAKRTMPDFKAGDNLRVNVRVTEGTRERIQAYEGVCISRQGSGVNESFTVRKISYGEGVERLFPIYSPMIDSVEVVRRGKVRRAKLYYLRDRRGKSARITEATDVRTRRLQEGERQIAIEAKAAKEAEKIAAAEAAAAEAAAAKAAAEAEAAALEAAKVAAEAEAAAAAAADKPVNE